MIKINTQYLAKVQQAKTGADLSPLLQDALRLEHATIPPYLTAAYSLKLGTNNVVRNMVLEVAVQEMLHLAIVANVINAVGGRPRFADPALVPKYPGPLPMSIGGVLVVGLKKFSKELVRDAFMTIEQPEHPLEFPSASAAGTFATIGEFYQAVIDKINELGDGVFTGNSARQVTGGGFALDQLFPITNAATAAKGLKQIVVEGEGTSSSPIGDHGEFAHYYRFASIVRGRMLVPNTSVPQGYSYTGRAIPFDPAGVWDFPDDTKTADYPDGSDERKLVVAFNAGYSGLLRQLDSTFDGHPETINAVVGQMGPLRTKAALVVSQTNPATGRQCGLTFEYVPA
jgi:hypothetical protein